MVQLYKQLYAGEESAFVLTKALFVYGRTFHAILNKMISHRAVCQTEIKVSFLADLVLHVVD